MEADLGSITIHYEMFGTGTPILFIHGAAGDHQAWLGVDEQLFVDRQDWKRIYLDLPGHGKTPAPDWLNTNDQVLDVLLQFIDRVIPGVRFAVSGFSWGGYLAQGIVYMRFSDVIGLRLIGPAMHRNLEPKPERMLLVKDETLLTDLDPYLKGLAESALVVQTPDTIGRLRTWQLLVQSALQDDANFHSRLQWAYSFDVDKFPQPFDKPTLILLGRQDNVVGYRDAWRAMDNFPRATFTVLDQAGHMIASLEHVELCQNLSMDWLDRMEQANRG